MGFDLADHDLVEATPSQSLLNAESGISVKSLTNGDPLPGRQQSDPLSLPGNGAAQAELSGSIGNQALAVVHQRPVIGSCPVPFQHGKFRKVKGAPLPGAETFTDLKYFRITGRQKPLHAEFRGSLEKPFARGDGIDIGFRCRRRNPQRRFTFEKPLIQKEPAD
ncbi:MAG: hypothetical protein ACD_87C00235G0002 [uncultured bacterium]|nr:MAG: hypothetical protein ACD_87C00235G0002 [uncultured bacterium]